MKYRKKPVVIEAFQYDGDLMGSDGKYYVPRWAVEAYEKGVLYFKELDTLGHPCTLFVKTLEGNMHASVGDYIIQGVNGEIYPCKPDIFEKTYECETESKQLSFGDALCVLKAGGKVARKGWNGKGMFIYYVPGAKYEACTEIGESIADEENKVAYEPYLAIKNVKGTVSTWVPSINDCLADDWEVV